MTDAIIYNITGDGGEVTPDILTSGSLKSSVYLALFGGNRLDDGRDFSQNQATWWGNRLITEPERRYVSETQYILWSLPASSSNLLRVKDAIKRDLSFLGSVDVNLLMVSEEKLEIQIEIGIGENIKILADWGGTR